MSGKYSKCLPQIRESDKLCIFDGGLETTLVFHHGQFSVLYFVLLVKKDFSRH